MPEDAQKENNELQPSSIIAICLGTLGSVIACLVIFYLAFMIGVRNQEFVSMKADVQSSQKALREMRERVDGLSAKVAGLEARPDNLGNTQCASDDQDVDDTQLNGADDSQPEDNSQKSDHIQE
jgi:hypothetical protein